MCLGQILSGHTQKNLMLAEERKYWVSNQMRHNIEATFHLLIYYFLAAAAA